MFSSYLTNCFHRTCFAPVSTLPFFVLLVSNFISALFFVFCLLFARKICLISIVLLAEYACKIMRSANWQVDGGLTLTQFSISLTLKKDDK